MSRNLPSTLWSDPLVVEVHSICDRVHGTLHGGSLVQGCRQHFALNRRVHLGLVEPVGHLVVDEVNILTLWKENDTEK